MSQPPAGGQQCGSPEPYGQQPPLGQNPPAYGQNPPAYGQNPPAYGQPTGYGQPGQPAGYGQPGYGAPGYGPPAGRPSQLTAAAVLGFILGGLYLVVALVYFAGGSIVSSFGANGGLLALFGVFFLVLGGAAIWGSVMVLSGKDTRILLGTAAVGVVIEVLGWIAVDFNVGSLLYLALEGVIIAMIIQPPSKQWVAARGGKAFSFI